MTIAKYEAYRMPSGRRITVEDIQDGMVTYVIEGLKSLVPLRASVIDFTRMIGTSQRVA